MLIILGKLAKEEIDAKIGDKITYGNKEYEVVGFFETGNLFQDGCVFMGLNNVRDLVNDNHNLTSIFVKVDNDVDVDTVSNRIKDSYGENLTTTTSLSDMDMVKDMLDMINGVSLGISILAIIIGAVGIINTQLMSVMERTREIGVLKAVGWSNKRILIMIMSESIVLTLVAGILSTILAVVVINLLVISNFLAGVTPIFTLDTILKAFIMAIVVGIVGGIYPAFKATRLPPTEALRYE